MKLTILITLLTILTSCGTAIKTIPVLEPVCDKYVQLPDDAKCFDEQCNSWVVSQDWINANAQNIVRARTCINKYKSAIRAHND